MFKFLIDSHSLKKLTLFNLVYRETSLNNTYLSEKISISPRSVNRYIHTLNDEIFSLCNKNDFLQVDGLTYYKINAKYSNQEALDTFYCLKLFYLKKSLSFELIVKLGTQGKTLLSDLIVELSVSASYLLRVIKKISILLQKFDFTINIDKFNRLTLSGDEKKIRTFLFTLLSDSFQNIEWPFKNISRIEIQKIMTAGSVSSLKQLEDSRKELLFAIIYTRVSSKRYIKKPDPYIEDIFNILSKTENTNIPPISANFIGQSENQAIEILYYNFMVSVFISNTLSTSWKQNIGEQIYHKNHEVIKFCKGLINAIQEEKQVQLDIADKHIELYKFVLFYVLLLDFQLDSSPFLTLTFPTPNYNFNINNSA
ncbi:helix-turn-helix domain-containing protein, partial [Listeria monocytogenes]|nr:helix-turn-helix domain-containing protein [Listeria monocytogenes]